MLLLLIKFILIIAFNSIEVVLTKVHIFLAYSFWIFNKYSKLFLTINKNYTQLLFLLKFDTF